MSFEDRVAARIWQVLVDAKIVPAGSTLPPRREERA